MNLRNLVSAAGACAKALAPFSGVAAALARILRPGTGLIMLFRQEVSAAPEWLIIAAAIALLQVQMHAPECVACRSACPHASNIMSF